MAEPSGRDVVRERNRQAYREMILGGAERAFAARGFAGTRMSDVAKEAGVAIGTLYNYFENKDEIFRALIEMTGAQLLAQLEACYAAHDDPIDRLVALLRTGFAYLEEHRATFVVLMQLGGASEASMGRVAGAPAAEQHQECLAVTERAVAAAMEAGRIRKDAGTAAELAAFFNGAGNAVARLWLAGKEESARDRADFIVKTFLQGVGQ
jgi:AcrR family transcriptional regulator